MITSLAYIKIRPCVHIVGVFLMIALLRLLPFNFYLSMLIGHEVVIDNKEGNAINFINYIAVGLIGILAVVKLPRISARWVDLWPFLVLATIYGANLFLAPYSNVSWTAYQLSFLWIAMMLHLFTSSRSDAYHSILENSKFSIFFIALIAFSLFILIQLISNFPVSYIIQEYNDSFVNSVNVFGVMKQYYGYVAGFIMCYSFFVLEDKRVKFIAIVLVLLTAFGIRSFLIGMMGAAIFYSVRKPVLFFFILTLLSILVFFMWENVILNVLLDTRFYAYMNAFDIAQRFPFGVGLGGYPVYTENNNSELFASFYNFNAALDYVPNSPESDVVHIFGSLGLGFGLTHILIQVRLLILGFLRQQKMFRFEKCMYFYFVFITFFGISEDTIFTVSYWIFFGITSGIIATLQRRV